MGKPSVATRILALPRRVKRAVVLAVDAVSCFISVIASFYLRLGYWQIDEAVLWPTIVSITLVLALSLISGAYRAIFRYSGPDSLFLLFRVLLIHAVVFSTIFLFIGVTGVPRTVGLIQPLLLLVLTLGTRLIASSLLGGATIFPWKRGPNRVVMIYGAGSAGRQLAAALRASSELQLAGFIDDDPSLQNGVLNGVRVYDPANVHAIVLKHNVNEILLALPSTSRSRRAEIVSTLQSLKLHVRTLPGVIDLAKGTVSVNDLKELDIEDLLGRSIVPPDRGLLSKAITNRTVLVTGAGGSIGSELCRQIAALQPSTLVLVDHSEFLLYSIHQELTSGVERRDGPACTTVAVLASVTDLTAIENTIAAWRPDCIFHAAAYKHVPLVEQNVVQGAHNNIVGTLNVVDTAVRLGVEQVVLVSTDKAVRPTNVMGATKRLAEMILQARDAADAKGVTRLSMVRFGNVLGSSGSVVPLFRKQISAGGPVTITHPDVTRYFMTIPEAAQLVIQAGAMSTGGEVFVLDMGEPVKILDLAKNMIELSGMALSENDNDQDIKIEVVGLRPGEKLYEELLIGADAIKTAHPRILRAHEQFLDWGDFEKVLQTLREAISSGDADAVKAVLVEYVEGYQQLDEHDGGRAA